MKISRCVVPFYHTTYSLWAHCHAHTGSRIIHSNFCRMNSRAFCKRLSTAKKHHTKSHLCRFVESWRYGELNSPQGLSFHIFLSVSLTICCLRSTRANEGRNQVRPNAVWKNGICCCLPVRFKWLMSWSIDCFTVYWLHRFVIFPIIKPIILCKYPWAALLIFT